MNDNAPACPFCTSAETVQLGSADDGTSVYFCMSCDEEFQIMPLNDPA